MGGQFNINSDYLANPSRLARAFELGQIGGAEGFEIIGLLEAELKNDSWSQAPTGSSLLVLLAAYREALTFGGRKNVHALGEAIAKELRDAHGLLEKIRARVGMSQTTLFGSSGEVSARVTEALRRRRDHHELVNSLAPFSMAASEKRRPQGAPVQRPQAEREIQLENISTDIPAVAAVGREPLQLGQLGEFRFTLAVSQKPGDTNAFIGKVFVNGWNTGVGTIEIGFREDKTIGFRYLENLSDYQSSDHVVLLPKGEIVRFLKAWGTAYNQDALKPPRSAKDYPAFLRQGFPNDYNATDELRRLIGERGEPKDEEEFCRLVKDVALKMLEEGSGPDRAYLYEADVELLLKFIDAELVGRLSSDTELSQIRQRLVDFQTGRKQLVVGTAAIVQAQKVRTRELVAELGLPDDFAARLLIENITSRKLLKSILRQWPDENRGETRKLASDPMARLRGKIKSLSNHNLGELLKDTFGQVLTYAPVTGEEGIAALANLVVIINKARKAGIEVPIEDRLWQEAVQLSGRGKTQIGYPPPPSSSDR